MNNLFPLRRVMIPWGLALLVAVGLALLLAVGWLGAPNQDAIDLVQYLLFSGLISVGLGAGVLLWLRRGQGRLWQQVTLVYTLGVVIALFNIFLTAQLMFISADHDLLLLVLLLLFAAVVSLTLGYTLARVLSERVTALCRGAQELAEGNLQARVPLGGADELAQLAQEFNHLAARLAASDAERQRLENSRRELIAAISHDLRTPLTSLRAMIEALADGLVEDPATVTRYLTTMRGQVSHLNGLIDDLFELAQLDAGALRLDLQRVAPGDLVHDAVEGIYLQADARGVVLQSRIAPELGPVLAAPQKIERVLYNLLSNAIRHTPAQGSVTVSVARFEPAASERSSKASVIFEVSDTGEGIAPEDLPYVFDRFYRGEKSRSRATGGAGLGLAIARGIIEAHGGRIWIESTREQGTSVRFTLPSAITSYE